MLENVAAEATEDHPADHWWAYSKAAYLEPLRWSGDFDPETWSNLRGWPWNSFHPNISVSAL